MNGCCSGFCSAAGQQFTAAVAEGDLRRYRRKGPGSTTRMLRDAVLQAGGGATVLDVGAGVGALSFELLSGGFQSATAVDASPSYVAASRGAAERSGHGDRFTPIEGDFVTLAATLPPADVVVLDRVVCCYPAMEPLLEAAFAHSHRLVGLAYPHDRWYVRLVITIVNAIQWLRRNPFRSYLHSPPAMESLATRHGFRRVTETGSPVWSVVLYRRNGT